MSSIWVHPVRFSLLVSSSESIYGLDMEILNVGTSWRELLAWIIRIAIIANLDAVLLHSQGSMDTMEFIIETTCIADRLSESISSPKGSRRRVAIGTGQPMTPACRLYASHQPRLTYDSHPFLSFFFKIH